jgi:hypothetical protein
MPVQVKIRDSVSGKTGKAALQAVRKRYTNIVPRTIEKLPRNFSAVIANRMRGSFKENYIARAGWVKAGFSSAKYKADKDNFMRRGDSFNIGQLGVFPVIHGSEVFGRRTDTILRGISSRTGTTVRTDVIGKSKNAAEFNIKVGIDSSQWEGGQQHYYIPKKGPNAGRVVTGGMTTDNQLEAFSAMVSGGSKSIFVQLTTPQIGSLIKYISSVFSGTIRGLFLQQE